MRNRFFIGKITPNDGKDIIHIWVSVVGVEAQIRWKEPGDLTSSEFDQAKHVSKSITATDRTELEQAITQLKQLALEASNAAKAWAAAAKAKDMPLATTKRAETDAKNQAIINKLQDKFDDLTDKYCTISKACFAGDMEVLRKRGWVRWDTLTEQDGVLSCDENQPLGELAYKQIEELFRTETIIWHVHVRGEPGRVSAGSRVIRTSGEHPFYVYNRGWRAASALQPGDLLRSHDGKIVEVEEVFNNGVMEPVYNCRVADWHTYFVGAESWGGWSVWAHNTYSVQITQTRLPSLLADNGGLRELLKRYVAERTTNSHDPDYEKNLGFVTGKGTGRTYSDPAWSKNGKHSEFYLNDTIQAAGWSNTTLVYFTERKPCYYCTHLRGDNYFTQTLEYAGKKGIQIKLFYITESSNPRSALDNHGRYVNDGAAPLDMSDDL